MIVRDGRVLGEALRHDRLTLEEVESEMRLAGLARIEDVRFAVLEPVRKISFVKISDDRVARQQDSE